MTNGAAIRRIKPTDVPFAPDMTSAEVERLASIAAFSELDPQFRDSPRFRTILRTHSRIVNCQDGDIIVREGDWGNSAFFIISGTVIVEIEPPDRNLPDEMLGRRKPERKSFFQVLAQLWSNHTVPEFRDKKVYASRQINTRGVGQATRMYLQDVPAVMEKYRTVSLSAGQFFGELAALGRTARMATVFAKDDVQLLEIRWQGLRDLMRGDTGIKKKIDQGFRENALVAFLQNSPIFQHLADDEQAMQELVREAQLETFGEYDHVGSFMKMASAGTASNLESEPLIASEGEHPNGVIIVRSGLARVSRRHHNGHRTISYLTPGQMYGFEEIQEAWRTSESVPLRNSLRAIGYLMVVIVSTPLIEKYLLQPQQKSSQRRRRRQRDPLAGAELADISRLNQDFVEFLVQEKFVNGTAAMLINLDRCTRCDDCVRACASTHDGNPRFLRHGPVHRNVMVARACMHCHDPVCMIECPTGAISRRLDEGEVTINDATCIGCGTCSRNCPYDAIRMVEIRDHDGTLIRDESIKTRDPITKATKCDLCVDQLGGPACQRACPHDALVRMDMGDVATLAAWHDR